MVPNVLTSFPEVILLTRSITTRVNMTVKQLKINKEWNVASYSVITPPKTGPSAALMPSAKLYKTERLPVVSVADTIPNRTGVA